MSNDLIHKAWGGDIEFHIYQNEDERTWDNFQNCVN